MERKIEYLKRIVILLLVGLCFLECVKDNEFEVPIISGGENESLSIILEGINAGDIALKSISEVKELYRSGGEPLKIVSDIVMKGYVVSSDREGNFFKEIYIQDTPENPTSGMKIVLNLTNSYNKYNFGREVYLSLKDLYIGETNAGDGIIAVGGSVKSDNHLEIVQITNNQIENHVFRSETTAVIVPEKVIINGVNTNHIGVFISVDDCAFDPSLMGENYVDITDDFDTQRELVVCQGFDYFGIPVETSSFSLFANESLPLGGGSINGVVTKDFRGNVFVLALNSTDDIFLEETRCTPISRDGFSILLEEDFEETTGDINIENWTNYKELGTRVWKSYDDEFSLSTAASIGSFFSNNEHTISWLITPAVNLENTIEEFLSFETSNSFGDGSELEVLISTNWNGNEETILLATWQVLPANVIEDGINNENWEHSGYVELSEYEGTGYIAFKYTGNGGENFDGTYELDNIKIEGK